MNIRIEAIHFDADQKLQDFIGKKLGKLDQFYDRILGVEVILKLENTGQVRDKVVEAKLDVPGELLFASETNKTFEAAVDDIVNKLKRQLKRYKEKARTF